MMTEGTVENVYFPDDPYNSTLNFQGAADYVARNPEALIFAGPTGNKDAEAHMAFAASQERTAVATFDWLGMYAALFNLEGAANKIIADTEARYQCSAANAAALTADLQKEDKPKLLWANYFSSVPGWSVASCPTSDAAYYCEYAHHCGAEVVSRPEGMGFNRTYGSPTVYWYLDDDDFLELAKDAETWIYPSQTFDSVYEEKKELLDQFKSVQDRKVYDTQGQGAYGWHEQRLAEYDVVALDMCTIVGTSNPNVLHQNRWFRNYYDDPIGSPGFCDAPDELDMPYIPAQAACEPIRIEDAAVVTNEPIESEDAAVVTNEPIESEDTAAEPAGDESETEGETEEDAAAEAAEEESASVVTNAGFATVAASGVLALLMV